MLFRPVSVAAMAGVAPITAYRVMKMQRGDHMQRIENKRLEWVAGDDTSESAEFSEIRGKGLATPQR
jgi:hypothetical protein